MKFPSLYNLTPLNRLRLAAAIGLLGLLFSAIARLIQQVDDDPTAWTRWASIVVFIGFILASRRCRFVERHILGVGFAVSMALMLHLMNMLFHTKLGVSMFVAIAMIMTMLCAVSINKSWIVLQLGSWSAASLTVAWTVEQPEITPAAFTTILLPLDCVLYVVMVEMLETREELARQKMWLAKSQSVARMAGWEFDPKAGQIQWSNSTFDLLGIEDQGKSLVLKEFFEDPRDFEQLEGKVRRCVGFHDDFNLQFPIRTVTDEKRWLLCRAEFVEEENRPGRVVGVVVDVTETVNREQELLEARDKAESAAQARTRFLANMSHEIRTPMNGVIGMASLLLESELPKKERSYVEIIRNSGDSLLGIINEILDFSKYDSGKVELEVGGFVLEQIISEAMDIVSAQAEYKGLDLYVDMPPFETSTFLGDATRLRQVLVNLLSNAVKFTDSGEVVLKIEGDVTANVNGILRFSISDTGCGIAASALEFLFDPFVQEDTTTTRRFGGTGLGLAISREIINAMGGEIEVRSEVGKGSEFFFSIQLLAGERGESARLSAGSRRVGLITKNQRHQLTCRRVVERLGGTLEVYRSVAEVQQANGPPVCLLVDAFGVSIDTLKQLDNKPRLLMFGSLTRQAAFHNLFFEWLRLPLQPSRLASVLLRASEPIAAVVEPLPDRESFSQLRVLLAEDNRVNQIVARQMLDKLGCQADLAQNGRETVHMLCQQSYDLVFMDLQMPDVDGLEATRMIRGHPDITQPYIIAMTANAMEQDRKDCEAAGMDDFVAKPVRILEISDALGRAADYLGNRQ